MRQALENVNKVEDLLPIMKVRRNQINSIRRRTSTTKRLFKIKWLFGCSAVKLQDGCVYFLKQFNSKTRDGFTVNSKVPSMKDPGKEYDGFTITITGDR